MCDFENQNFQKQSWEFMYRDTNKQSQKPHSAIFPENISSMMIHPTAHCAVHSVYKNI